MNHLAHKALLAVSFEVIGHESLQSLVAQLGWTLRACESVLERASGIMPDMKKVNLF
jgi:hypothetical protein